LVPTLPRLTISTPHDLSDIVTEATFAHIMRTTVLSIITLLVLAIMALSARTSGNTPRPVVSEMGSASIQDLKPPSELALVMRALAIHADSVKATLGTKRALPPYPTEAATLLTAKATDGIHIDPITFPTFAHDYLKKLDVLYKAKKKDRALAYNALILGCATCHTTHCPGPLMRIKKMYAPITDK